MGAWCEASTDFDLLVELIAHALADEETSTIQVAHHQSAARQKCKLLADFGQMHLAWAQHLLDNREFVKMEGRSELCSGQNEAAYGGGPLTFCRILVQVVHSRFASTNFSTNSSVRKASIF